VVVVGVGVVAAVVVVAADAAAGLFSSSSSLFSNKFRSEIISSHGYNQTNMYYSVWGSIVDSTR
jgi:hypothetical protein